MGGFFDLFGWLLAWRSSSTVVPYNPITITLSAVYQPSITLSAVYQTSITLPAVY